VLDTTWNVLAWNKGAAELFGDFGKLPEKERNFARLIFVYNTFDLELFRPVRIRIVTYMPVRELAPQLAQKNAKREIGPWRERATTIGNLLRQ
jgi:hypothetical protein